MNPIGFVFRWIAEMLCRTRFKRLVINDAYAKLLIITGGLRWHDLPHLHHPLVYMKINFDYRRDLPKLQEVKQDLEEDYNFTLNSDESVTMMMNPGAIARLTNKGDID